jgi:hypothetical protein
VHLKAWTAPSPGAHGKRLLEASSEFEPATAVLVGKCYVDNAVASIPAAFAVVAENQEKAADEATAVLLKRFSGNPDVQKARAEFERAQKVEERFHTEFDGLDFSSWQAATSAVLG